uniref:Fatty acid hydroxylase domain-containing protein n=1 Tax=Lotharella globosa TaxID=91324 RepID=A0A7S4DZG1_9EUKA
METLLNPLELSPLMWVGGYVAKTAALAIWDLAVGFIVKSSGAPKLPTTDKLKGLPELQQLDYIYLAVNSVIEYIFMLGIMSYAWTSPDVGRRVEDLGLLNTLVALWVIFVVDDFFYTPCHLLMHTKALYKYVHKHHHRQNLPTRGYPDAGNEHPIEQVIGMSCVWGALLVTSKLIGLHAATVLIYFGLYAALAMLNHMRYDVTFNALGFTYSVRCHEMHHRFPRCNYAQYFMLWDKLLGTYRDYEVPK